MHIEPADVVNQLAWSTLLAENSIHFIAGKPSSCQSWGSDQSLVHTDPTTQAIQQKPKVLEFEIGPFWWVEWEICEDCTNILVSYDI